MDFFTFNDATSNQFDEPAQKLLRTLAEVHGTVELRELTETNEWCVRVVTDYEGDKLPLAALGDTPFEAANRLIRICGIPG